jgi:hypothetical protein
MKRNQVREIKNPTLGAGTRPGMTPLGQKEVEHRIIRSLPYKKTLIDIIEIAGTIFGKYCGQRYPKTVLKDKKREKI